MTPRWLKMAHRINGDKLMIAVPDWRTVLAAGSTVSAPASEAVYAANWSDFDANNTLRYYKDPFGVVHINGGVKKGAAVAVPETVFTLPVGYRPDIQIGFVSATSTGTVAKQFVLPNGNVRVSAGTAADIAATLFIHVSFRADTSASDV